MPVCFVLWLCCYTGVYWCAQVCVTYFLIDDITLAFNMAAARHPAYLIGCRATPFIVNASFPIDLSVIASECDPGVGVYVPQVIHQRKLASLTRQEQRPLTRRPQNFSFLFNFPPSFFSHSLFSSFLPLCFQQILGNTLLRHFLWQLITLS